MAVEQWGAEESLVAERRSVLSREGPLARWGVQERLGALARWGLVWCLGVREHLGALLDWFAPMPGEDPPRGQNRTGSEYCAASAGNLVALLAEDASMRTALKLEVAARKQAGYPVWWAVTLAIQEERCHCSMDREDGGVDASGPAQKKVAARSWCPHF